MFLITFIFEYDIFLHQSFLTSYDLLSSSKIRGSNFIRAELFSVYVRSPVFLGWIWWLWGGPFFGVPKKLSTVILFLLIMHPPLSSPVNPSPKTCVNPLRRSLPSSAGDRRLHWRALFMFLPASRPAQPARRRNRPRRPSVLAMASSVPIFVMSSFIIFLYAIFIVAALIPSAAQLDCIHMDRTSCFFMDGGGIDQSTALLGKNCFFW